MDGNAVVDRCPLYPQKRTLRSTEKEESPADFPFTVVQQLNIGFE
jgi:hypothetical protein